MERVDLNLQNIIYNFLGDLSEPSIHYIILARYYLYQDQKTRFASIHFYKNAVDNIEIFEEGIQCKFSFGHEFDDERFVIKIYFRHIVKVLKYTDASYYCEEILFNRWTEED